MRSFKLILCIITCSFLLCSCKAVTVTSADELLKNSWVAENKSLLKAELSFNIRENSAKLTIEDQNGEEFSVNGVFAVDSKNLYITSSKLAKTYEFSYKVYKDRLLLTYNGSELTFYAKEKEP